MAKTISNDAIWEKLSEIDEKLEKIVLKQKSFSPKQEEVGDEPPSDKIKDEIITQIKADIRILGLSNDSHFEANLKNITTLNNNVLSIKKVINNLSAPENINMNEIKALLDKKNIFRLGFISFRKTSFIITILGMLIFTLTVFSMKLYSDSLINQNKYYRQVIFTRKLQSENDSLKVKVLLPSTPEAKKKKKMKDLNSYVSLYKEQLKKGDIQKAYKELIRYVMSLKSHLARTLAETYSFGNVSLGYLDYTYFYCIDSYLRERKLRFCIVLNHEKMRFELWLVGQNSEIQKKYWNILKDTEWNKHQTSMPKYSVLECVLIENPDFNNLKLLTKQIENEITPITNEIIEYLRKRESNLA